ncbi:MAG TPA: 50S ribosomal protein L11, partial [Devosiaceae bacterium]|nr:50S ribosomal protein L11 [Devosiaceae bacterium]
PIGPALGQRGLNIMEFCKSFNVASENLDRGAPIPVVITIFADKSFTFEMKMPPVSHYLKQAAKAQKGSQKPGHESGGQISRAQLREIAEKKMPDLNAYDVEAAMAQVAGAARSMGIEVVGS